MDGIGAWVAVFVFAAVCLWMWRMRDRTTAEVTGGVTAGPPTMELRPEPPAVVSALLHGGQPRRAAVPATLLDLAARNHLAFFQVAEGHTVVYRTVGSDAARDFEAALLAPLGAAGDPARGLPLEEYVARLDFGLDDRLGFHQGVRAELLAGGLLRRRGGFFSWESLTPAGRAAASHWLGVAAYLRGNPTFETLPPAAVVIWDRLLAYAAALDVAYDATAPILAAFERRRPTATELAAVAHFFGAHLAGGDPFDPASYGITPTSPFGPDGPHPVALRGLLAGWCAVGYQGAGAPDWWAQFAARAASVRAGLPAEGAEDAALLVTTMESAMTSGRGWCPLGELLADIRPAVHLCLLDCTARVGSSDPAEIRGWMVLRAHALGR